MREREKRGEEKKRESEREGDVRENERKKKTGSEYMRACDCACERV